MHTASAAPVPTQTSPAARRQVGRRAGRGVDRRGCPAIDTPHAVCNTHLQKARRLPEKASFSDNGVSNILSHVDAVTPHKLERQAASTTAAHADCTCDRNTPTHFVLRPNRCPEACQRKH